MLTYTVWTKPGCPHCDRAKELLKRENINFEVVDHDTPEKVAEFKAKGHKTFPRVFDESGILIGGADDLEDYLSF